VTIRAAPREATLIRSDREAKAAPATLDPNNLLRFEVDDRARGLIDDRRGLKRSTNPPRRSKEKNDRCGGVC
jgi:hypothetical protein